MDEGKKKTLLIAGGGGLLLAVIFLASRGTKAAGSSTATDATYLESLYSSITEGYTGAIEGLRDEFAGEIEGVRTETGAALEEQKGLFESFTDAINSTLEGITESVNGLLGRVTTLEAETADLAETVQSETARLEGVIGAETARAKTQAEIIDTTHRLKSAQASLVALTAPHSVGLSTDQISGYVNRIALFMGLSSVEKAALQATGNQIYNYQVVQGKGPYGYGSEGVGFLSPVVTGPMGSYVGSAFGKIPIERHPQPPTAGPVWGVRIP